jgi:endonuclease/exonuclease/phosphatase family metal-dependent hydrolase
MKIKIIEYNILEGFFDKNKEGILAPNEKRRKAAQEIIKKEDPDILVLAEADHTKNLKFPQDYKKIFNYTYGFFASKRLTNRDFGIGILSKFPIITKEKFLLAKSRWIKTSIKINGKTINIDAIHCNPHNSSKEKQDLFQELITRKKEPFIVAGDFNAVHPEDKYNEKDLLDNFCRKFQDKQKAEKVVKEILEAKTIRFLLEQNLRDTHKEKNNKQDYSYHTSLKGNNMMRIDYIFCSNEFKIINSGIIKNRLTEIASDHYPIFAELEI